MNFSQIEADIKYITNASGEKTEVIIPVHLWETLLGFLNPPESGLDPVDEHEPHERILADLKQALKDANTGQTSSAYELFEGSQSDSETALLSEAALAQDWLCPEEEDAWSHLQSVQ